MKQFAVPRKWLTIIGCAGFGLIILMFGVYAATSIFSWDVKIPLGIGVACALAFWILTAMTSRAARYGTNVAVVILLAFCILALVNFVSARRFARIDTTMGKQFSLSEQTKKILKSLEQDITVTAFYTQDHYRRRFAEDTLNEYAQQSSRFHLSFIDPNLKPGLAMTYRIRQNGTVVFESENGRKDVESYQNEEQDFTSTILKLVATEQKKLYFLDGHGERDIDGSGEDSYSDLKKLVEADNYQVDKLVLAAQSSIPGDCTVLVIAGPQQPLLPREEGDIIRYMAAGGKAIIMADPAPSPSMARLLERWSVKAADDIVLDSFGQSYFGDPSVPVIARYADHLITSPIASVMTFFPMARSLAPMENSQDNLEVVQLARTSKDSWGELDTEMLLSKRSASNDEGVDSQGPMCIAVAVSVREGSRDEPSPMPGQPPKETPKEKRVLVAMGDSDFVTNRYLKAGNPDLFMNAVNWLSEEEDLISIRPKDQEQARIQQLTGRQMRFVTYFSIFAVPLLILIAGGGVWWKRR